MRTLLLWGMVLSLLAVAACSGGDEPTVDSGGPGGDHGGTPPVDRGGPRPDQGPKKPAQWVLLPGNAPAVYDHTATTLADGRVLFAGGSANSSSAPLKPVRDSYLFDPKSNSFNAAGKMLSARTEHLAVALDDGRVLVFGGRQEQYKILGTAELFDPKQPAASAWTSAGKMSGPRTAHAAVKLKGGQVLTVGGVGDKVWEGLASIELYNPQQNSWSAKGVKLKTGRSLLSATLLKNGLVLIAGGYDGSKWLRGITTFDPANGTLTVLGAQLSEARCAHSATRLQDDRVLLVGGSCGSSCSLKGNDLYNPTTGKVSSLAHSGAPPASHAAVRLRDGRALVCGGRNTKDRAKVVVFSAAAGGAWTTLPSMKYGRAGHTATLLPDGSVLVVGGQAGKVVNRAERLHHP